MQKFKHTENDNELPQRMIEPTNNATQGGKVLCTHDGVLLKKANAEYMRELNTSGALSLVEYTTPRQCVYLEWQPNLSILVANDIEGQDDWSLVEKISGRTRTVSECSTFNSKPTDIEQTEPSSPRSCNNSLLYAIRAPLDELCTIEVKHRRQVLRFMRRDDRRVHSEYFFQHGNADQFVRAMRNMHLIENVTYTRGGELYDILTGETQKLKKTFAELDIGDIKASSVRSDSWLPNKVVDFLIGVPDLVQPRHAPKSRPNALHTNGQHAMQSNNSNGRRDSLNSASSSECQSRAESTGKTSPNDVKNLEQPANGQQSYENHLPELQIRQRGQVLTKTQWLEFQEEDGRINDCEHIKEIIFNGGIEHELRCEVWKYLLDYYKWSETSVERIKHRNAKTAEYYGMKAQWLSMTRKQESNFSAFRERKSQIEKDVKRTDRSIEYFAGANNPHVETLHGILMTYAMYNFDLGYVQGMSDLLAPILEIQDDEVDAFWCFVGFMDIVIANFDMDQAGMKKQFTQLHCLLKFANPRLFNYFKSKDSDSMIFCFRWLLVWYKREIANSDVFKLWECFWTGLPCPNFHILFSVALLDKETDTIIENDYDFTEILKHINELSGRLDVDGALQLADAIYRQLKASETLPNDIRQIIGEPLLSDTSDSDTPEEFEDSFESNRLPELTVAEARRQEELLEFACNQSMFLQHF